ALAAQRSRSRGGILLGVAEARASVAVDELVLADLNHVAVPQDVMLDAARADVQPVRAVQVLDDALMKVRRHLRVMPRDELAADLQIVVRRAADDEAAGRKGDVRDELVVEEQIEGRRR